MADRLSPPTPGGSLFRRVWDLPLRAHLAALAIVLVALLPLVGTGSSFSADEGAAIIQARSLARGDGWVVEHPVPEADPTGAAYPLELSERGPDGTAPFGKHPLYALLLAGADRVGGATGMMLLSVLGTAAAAGLAALLARRLDVGLARPTLWAAGLASPLLFDGYVVIAHTLGAACAAGAVLAAASAFERRSRAAALVVLPCVAAATLLRTEALFVGLGLAAAAVVVGRRHDRTIAVLVGGGALLAALGARVAERAWTGHALGGATIRTGSVRPPGTSGFLAARWQAFVITWLRPGYDAGRLVNLLLVVMLAAVIFGAYAVRKGRRAAGTPAAVVGTLAAVAGAAALAALALAPDNLVPGLLVACPVIVAGVVLARRETVATVTARLAVVTAAVFALCVLATQYSTGGSGEWGARYFALALPVALPVVLLAVSAAGSRAFVGGLVVCALALGVMGVGSIRSTHDFAAGLITAIDRTAGPDRPVLVTLSPLVPRLAWSTFDHQRWLLARPDDLAGLVDRLGAAGIDRFTFVASGEADVARLPAGLVHEERSEIYHGWRILVLRATPGGPPATSSPCPQSPPGPCTDVLPPG